MAATPEEKTSKASVEASLASKAPFLARLPPGMSEQHLERCAKDAYPGGSEQERDEFRRYWRERLDRERELLDRERERRDRPGTLPRGGYPIQEIPNGAMEYPAHFSAEARAAVEAAEMFVSLPEYSGIQVWMQDRLNKLAAAATNECSLFGSKACARVALSRYNIKAAAFRRLVSDIKLQNAFMTLLNHWEDVAWSEFTGIGTPKEIRSGAPSIAPGLARRKRWWIRQGYKQLESLRQAQHVSDRESQPAPPANAAEMQAQQTDLPNVTDSPVPGSELAEMTPPRRTLPKARKTPSERLTEYKVLKPIRTQELVAVDLGLERSVYFDLKAGRKVSEETYIKAALRLGCSPDDLKP
jgi:hypothetical protein